MFLRRSRTNSDVTKSVPSSSPPKGGKSLKVQKDKDINSLKKKMSFAKKPEKIKQYIERFFSVIKSRLEEGTAIFEIELSKVFTILQEERYSVCKIINLGF